MGENDEIKGIIYRLYNAGDSDLIVNIIDEEGKKESVLAKNTKNLKSRKKGSLEIGNFVSVKIIKLGKVQIIKEIFLKKSFRFWKEEYEKLLALQLFCEVIDKFCFEGNSEKGLYNIFSEVLNSETGKMKLVINYFILKALLITGHIPELNRDIKSLEILKENSIFLSDEIGYVLEGKRKIESSIIKIQNFILRFKLSDTLKINANNDLLNELFFIHKKWMNSLFEKPLLSLELIK